MSEINFNKIIPLYIHHHWTIAWRASESRWHPYVQDLSIYLAERIVYIYVWFQRALYTRVYIFMSFHQSLLIRFSIAPSNVISRYNKLITLNHNFFSWGGLNTNTFPSKSGIRLTFDYFEQFFWKKENFNPYRIHDLQMIFRFHLPVKQQNRK